MGTLLEAAQKLRAAMDIAGAKLDDATALDAMLGKNNKEINLYDR